MLSDPLIIRWLIGALAVGWNALRTWQYMRKQPTEFNSYMFWFYSLTALGLLIWAAPILISDHPDVLFMAQLIGDIVLISGMSFSWLIANNLFFHSSSAVKKVLYVFLPTIIIVNAIASWVTLTDNQPYFDSEGFFIADRPVWYFVLYSIVFVPTIPIGIYMTAVTRNFPAFRQRLRSGTIGVLITVVGLVNVLIPFGLSIEVRNAIYLISFGLLLLTTVLVIALPRKKSSTAALPDEQTIHIVRG
jgi:hypothetical protein